MENNESIGAVLKAHREQQQVDLETICRKTYIRQSYLEAIENGDYESIGDLVYVKGFIRNYAQAIGMNGDEAVRLFGLEMNAASGISVAAGGSDGLEVPGRASYSSRKRRGRRQTDKRSFTRVEWTILLAGAVLIALFWIWMLYL